MKEQTRRAIIDNLLLEREAVSVAEMARVLNVSIPTVKRDLHYMRYKLGAPLVYSRKLQGYCYKDVKKAHEKQMTPMIKAQYRLQQRSWFNAAELYTLVRMQSLILELSKDECSSLVNELTPLRARLLELACANNVDPEVLLSRVQILEMHPVIQEGPSFEVVGLATMLQRRVQISWAVDKEPGKSPIREISPLRLVFYRGRWYVYAFSHTDEGYRTFAIDNIKRAEILENACIEVSKEQMDKAFDDSYGMFSTGTLRHAIINFDERVERYIRREAWHPNQRFVRRGKFLQMFVPYRSDTELVGAILRWGSHAEVVSPDELREAVKRELLATLERYEQVPIVTEK